MSEEPPSSRPSLADLEARLQRARNAGDKRRGAGMKERQNALGIGFRLSAELVSTVIVGGLIGWALDHWLKTAPWCLLGFFLLGVIAGMMNVIRTAREMNAKAARSAQDIPPAAPDDDDD